MRRAAKNIFDQLRSRFEICIGSRDNRRTCQHGLRFNRIELLRLCLFAAQFELRGKRQRCGVCCDSHQSSSVPTSVKLALSRIVTYTSRRFPYAARSLAEDDDVRSLRPVQRLRRVRRAVYAN